jgi:alpha-maltose-1-phosphate synthase
VAVDVEATARAFVQLFESPELRARMGVAARERARSTYDWRVIIPQYEALWAQLAEIRRAQGGDAKPVAHPWPARMDPFHAFGAYPTVMLGPQTRLALADGDVAAARERLATLRRLVMVDYAKLVHPSEAETDAVLQALAAGPRTAGECVAAIAAGRQPYVLRGLAWMAKMGVLRVV